MSDTNWWFLDLALVILVTGALSFGLLLGVPGVGRIVIALPLLLVLPGYALVSVLFPDDPSEEYYPFDAERTGLRNPLLVTGGLELIERLVLSVVCSVFLVPVVALFTHVTPRGFAPETVIFGISALTIGLTVLAIIARARYPTDQRFTPTLPLSVPFFTQTQSPPSEKRNLRPYNVGIAIGLLLLVATAGFAVANPPQHDGFTEFAVDTEDVTSDTETMYQSTYTAGETQELPVLITNHEHEERTYTTVVLLEQVSYDGDEATVHESEQLQHASATVPDGEQHHQTLEVTPTMQGDDLRLTVLLYEGDPPDDPNSENAYRVIHLPIVVQ
ncbi:DUF1616 domain-containing protein [Natronosalvus vescus]|uniref:DUF1616 domain-containing protein n=1 Tax=Natronosalvus vescus TaxID=2953881 RepID=UPI00209195C0|nr:DUF1616 domain-containing protein [Natronosalvus vescus]